MSNTEHPGGDALISMRAFHGLEDQMPGDLLYCGEFLGKGDGGFAGGSFHETLIHLPGSLLKNPLLEEVQREFFCLMFAHGIEDHGFEFPDIPREKIS